MKDSSHTYALAVGGTPLGDLTPGYVYQGPFTPGDQVESIILHGSANNAHTALDHTAKVQIRSFASKPADADFANGRLMTNPESDPHIPVTVGAFISATTDSISALGSYTIEIPLNLVASHDERWIGVRVIATFVHYLSMSARVKRGD